MNERKNFIQQNESLNVMDTSSEIEPQMTTELSYSELLENFDQLNTSIHNLVRMVEGKNETPIMTQVGVFSKYIATLETPYHVHYVNKVILSLTVNNIKPIKPWKPAKPGAVEEFSGLLAKQIPVLAAISEDELDDIIDNVRNKEEN